MSYKAIDVARHVINFTNSKGESISNLKLQKVLYFLQGFYFSEFDEELFEDEIEAWRFGPVVRNVYVEFAQYGGLNIPSVEKIVERNFHVNEDGTIQFGRPVPYKDKIEEDVCRFIDRKTERLFPLSASQLVTYTHQVGPWKESFDKAEKSTIPKSAIRDHFLERKKAAKQNG